MVEFLIIGGAVLFGGLLAGVASSSSSRNEGQINNQNNINNSLSASPLQTPYEIRTCDYRGINNNKYNNSINSMNQTNYTSYNGFYQNQNYGNFDNNNNGTYGYCHKSNYNNYQQQVNNKENKMKNIYFNNQHYIYRRSPEKINKNNNFQYNLYKPIQRRNLSPSYNIGRILNIENGENKIKEAKKIIELESLGKGGFGEVKKIIYKGYKYACKKIPKDLLVEESIKLAFQREIYILIKMNICENSVKFYKNFEDEQYQLLILELCDEDLLHYINENVGGLNENKIRAIMKQLNNTFKIFYKENIIHRDIKPSNILIKYIDSNKTNFIVKMSDYGLSKICQETRSVLGTPGYTSPEILEKKEYNHKVDLWSIGVMIYYMYFKEFPFGLYREYKDFYKNYLAFGGRKPKNAYSYYLDDLLNKLLVYDPNNRLSWPEYFNHPFFK